MRTLRPGRQARDRQIDREEEEEEEFIQNRTRAGARFLTKEEEEEFIQNRTRARARRQGGLRMPMYVLALFHSYQIHTVPVSKLHARGLTRAARTQRRKFLYL